MTTTQANPTGPGTPTRTARHAPGSQLVAIILAVAIGTALNLLTFAVMYDALFSSTSGISENATQILTGWGGGVLGVVGAVVGYRAGAESRSGGDTSP